MCSHNWQKIGEVYVCLRCGLSKTPDGKIMFDKRMVNYKPKRRKGGK